MRSMTGYGRGDVVLVEFAFSDESATKVRPALVISTALYHRAREEVIVAAITSNTRRRPVGDHIVVEWQQAGLLFPSSVTGIIRTIKRSMIRRRLGSLAATDLEAFERVLRRSLGI
jgi:mRNA interferase MazF